jgi:hypothetical protein
MVSQFAVIIFDKEIKQQSNSTFIHDNEKNCHQNLQFITPGTQK